MKILPLSIAITLIAGGFSITAQAQSNQEITDPGGDSSSQDTELADSEMHRSDTQRVVDDKFSSLDTNRDGTLSKTEALRSGLPRQMRELDSNGDDEISRAEFSKFEAEVPSGEAQFPNQTPRR